jgi:hypothetical protein
MTARSRRILAFLRARAAESATWRGLALVATVLGAKLEPQHTEAIVLAGLFVSGILGAAFPDKVSRGRGSDEGEPRP